MFHMFHIVCSPHRQLATSKGCHGIEPDNTNAWSNNLRIKAISSFAISKQDQLKFNQWIADTCHK